MGVLSSVSNKYQRAGLRSRNEKPGPATKQPKSKAAKRPTGQGKPKKSGKGKVRQAGQREEDHRSVDDDTEEDALSDLTGQVDDLKKALSRLQNSNKTLSQRVRQVTGQFATFKRGLRDLCNDQGRLGSPTTSSEENGEEEDDGADQQQPKKRARIDTAAVATKKATAAARKAPAKSKASGKALHAKVKAGTQPKKTVKAASKVQAPHATGGGPLPKKVFRGLRGLDEELAEAAGQEDAASDPRNGGEYEAGLVNDTTLLSDAPEESFEGGAQALRAENQRIRKEKASAEEKAVKKGRAMAK